MPPPGVGNGQAPGISTPPDYTGYLPTAWGEAHPANSVGAFKSAWRRVALSSRGGPVGAIYAKLRHLRIPPVRTDAAVLPRPPVALMWVPLSCGSPALPESHPRDCWPDYAIRIRPRKEY